MGEASCRQFLRSVLTFRDTQIASWSRLDRSFLVSACGRKKEIRPVGGWRLARGAPKSGCKKLPRLYWVAGYEV